MAADKATNGTMKDVSYADLTKEMERRQAEANKILAKRNRLARQLEALDQKLAARGLGPKVLPKRAKNSMSLVEALAKLLKGKELGIPEIMAQLPGVGYVSPSPNLRTMVNVSLLKKTHFRRTARGVYTAKA